MKNGWTGGQYSLYRVIAGVYWLIHFVVQIRNAPALFDLATLLVVIAAVASLFFIAGLYDRIAAIVMWSALIANASLPFAGWFLLAHALLPRAPYGSLAARGRVDPRGKWSMPAPIFAALWVVMSLRYAYDGYTTLLDPSRNDGATMFYGAVALLYAPLALFRRVRPWLWLAMLLMQLGLMVLSDFTDLGVGMIVLHLFTFDPAWVPRRVPATTDRVLYDGSCGLCHRSVRFLIAEDVSGTAFVYAPQEGGGATIIVETADGRTLTRSDAVVHMMHRLGGLWRAIAVPFALLPGPIRDAGYDFVARIRYRIFGKTKDACPLMPPELRSRFTV